MAHSAAIGAAHLTRYLQQSGLIRWDREALHACRIDPDLCRLLHTIAALEEDTALSAQQARALGIDRAADLGGFLPVWEREEAEHARALRHLLSGQVYEPPPPPLAANLMRRHLVALLPTRALHRFGPTAFVYCALGAAGEYSAIVSYTELIKGIGSPAVVALLRAITRQEGRHLAFFMAAAQARAATLSDVDGRVARRVLGSVWRPVGVPTLGLAAWRGVFARFLADDAFRRRVEGTDRVIDLIPHLGGLHLMGAFLAEHAPIEGLAAGSQAPT